MNKDNDGTILANCFVVNRAPMTFKELAFDTDLEGSTVNIYIDEACTNDQNKKADDKKSLLFQINRSQGSGKRPYDLMFQKSAVVVLGCGEWGENQACTLCYQD